MKLPLRCYHNDFLGPTTINFLLGAKDSSVSRHFPLYKGNI